MLNVDLDWDVVSAVGQVAGAFATFCAVLVSLHLARKSRRPDAKLKVGARLIIGDGVADQNVLMFSVTNCGERSIHIRTIGWKTGWFKYGPACLKKRYAVQLTGGVWGSVELPYELTPGAEASSFCLIENIEQRCRENAAEPLFTRDYPLLGRRRTRVKSYVYIAEGFTFHAKPEKSLLKLLRAAELQAKQQTA